MIVDNHDLFKAQDEIDTLINFIDKNIEKEEYESERINHDLGILVGKINLMNSLKIIPPDMRIRFYKNYGKLVKKYEKRCGRE